MPYSSLLRIRAPWTDFATADRLAYDLPHPVLPVEAGLDAEVGGHKGTYSRECLALEVARWITAEDVFTLARLFMQRGEPDYIRSDNGPEFIAKALMKWLAASGVKTLYFEPGAPWEDAYSETFIRRPRDELLNREMFANLKEAKVLVEDFRDQYNHHRPPRGVGVSDPGGVYGH